VKGHPVMKTRAAAGAVCLVLSVVAGLVMAAGIAARPGGQTASKTPLLTDVSMNYIPLLAVGGVYVADDLGLFAKHGVKMSYTTNNLIYGLLPQLSQGQLDIDIVGTGAAFMNAVNSGFHVKAAVDRIQLNCSADNMLVVREALWKGGIRTPAQLRGRSIAINAKGSATNYWLDVLLAKYHMTESDLSHITILGSYSDTLNALKTGAVDFAFMAEPLGGYGVLHHVAEKVIGPQQIVPNFEEGLTLFSQDFIDRNGGTTARNWVEAYLQGVRYMENPRNKKRVIEIMAKWTHVNKTLLRAEYGTDQWPWANPNGYLNTNSMINKDGAWALEHHLIAKIPPVSEWYAGDIISSALKEIGTVHVTRRCSSVPEFPVKKK
jgi:NitT/TauT family transport system substrate-binding protein